jgi:hypothetical protein
MACVFYHKDNNKLTELDGLAFTNGATLEIIIEAIDEKIKELNVLDFNLPCLRVTYVIHTLEQFAEAVDTEICLIKDSVADLTEESATPFIANDSATIDFTTSGTLNHTLTGSVKLSETSGNRLSEEIDGIYVDGQILSIDYDLKTISISDGNTLNFASLMSGTLGFLGNLASDPSATDGQYWYNTSSNLLKIKVNGLVKTITIS